MTDQTAVPSSSAASAASSAGSATGSASPGALLRAAREQRGVHLAALAGAIKVAPARLEALEADDYSGMPDTTFARALAQAVCRALKIDPAPVLALMPESFHSRLERVDEGINAPFRERPGGLGDSSDRALWRHPVLWLAALLLVAAAAFVWWPRSLVGADSEIELAPQVVMPAEAASAPEPEAAASTVGADGSNAVPTPWADTAASAPRLGILADAAPGSTAAASAPAQAQAPTAVAVAGDGAELRAVQDTWVQVSDSSGKVLLARTVVAGEALSFSGPWPMKFRIGNVQGSELRFRGQAVDLKAMTRDNTLSLSLPPTSP